MTDNKRLGELIAILKSKKRIRNQKEFSELLDANPNVVSRYATGIETLTERFADIVCQVFTEVNKDWLLFGTEPILKYAIQGKVLITEDRNYLECKKCLELAEKLQGKSDELLELHKKNEKIYEEKEELRRTIDRIYAENPQIPRPHLNGKSKAG